MSSQVLIGVSFIFITIIVYGIARKVNKLIPHPLTLPILLSAVILIFLLTTTGIHYETYMIGGKWIDQLLGPAVVALAIPLYRQRIMLKTYAWPILSGVFLGSVVGIGSGYIFGWMAGLEEKIILSLVPKSVTTPVAVSIVETAEGLPSLTAVFVIIAGISGAVIQPLLFTRMKLHHFLGRGAGMGTASHAIGTARSMENSEKEGAVSTVAMIISAVLVSFLVPLLFWFL